jgi:catechol-2,3-dioxygenase
MIPVRRLNHAVLYIREVDRAVAFYREAFGFEVVEEMPGRAAFLRAAGSDNHHDLGLFAIGPDAPGPQAGRVGLYHLAWEVSRIEDLADAAKTLERLGALVGASDHGASKSLYGKDPDGNEFEVMWATPRREWGDGTPQAPLPLDLERELARFGTDS